MMAHRFRLVEGLDIEDQLRHIQVPTLVLSGERDVLVSPASLSGLCDDIRDVSARPLPNCGHLAFVTKPELIGEESRAVPEVLIASNPGERVRFREKQFSEAHPFFVTFDGSSPGQVSARRIRGGSSTRKSH